MNANAETDGGRQGQITTLKLYYSIICLYWIHFYEVAVFKDYYQKVIIIMFYSR